MDMITIFSKKAFRFPNPEGGLISKPKAGERPEEAGARVIADSSRLGNRDKHKALFFDTVPNEIQQAPAWIKQDEMWAWALADGDILEVVSKSPRKQEAEVAAKSKKADDDEDEESYNDNFGNEEVEKAPPGATRKRVVKAKAD